MDPENQGNEGLDPAPAGAPPAAARPRSSARDLAAPLAAFLCLAAVVVVAGLLIYRNQAAAVRAQQGRELAAIRDLKAADISRWFADEQASAWAAGDNRVLSAAVSLWTSAGAGSPAPFVVTSLIDTTRAEQGYVRILLLDRAALRIYATPRNSPAPGAVTRTLGEKAMDRREVVFSDLYLDAQERPKMVFLAPLVGGAPVSSPPPGVLALEVDPDAFLFPLVNGWPTTSKTGETVLVERRGDKVIVLNTTRERRAAALHLAFPLSQVEVPAVKAVRGALGVVTGVDSSGSAVLAAVGPVRGTPWFIVSKVDLDEVDAPLRRTALVTIVIGIGVILLAGAVMLFFWSRGRSRGFRRLYEAERELRASEMRFKSAFEHAPLGISLTLPDGRMGSVNATLAEMLGYSVAELEGRSVVEISHPDDRAETARLIATALAGDIDHFKVDRRYLRKDGSDLWAIVSVTLLRDEQGRPVHFVVMTSDISARKAAEEALGAGEARFRGLFENALIGFSLHEIVLDESGAPVDYVYVEANRAFYDLTGLDAAHVVGRRAGEVFADLREPPLLEIFGQVALGGGPQRFETYFEPLDRHWDIQAFSPQPGQFAVVLLDITERVRARRTLEAFFDSQKVGLGILDRELRYVRVNETLADINQVLMSDHLGRKVEDVLPEHAADIIAALDSVLRGEAVDSVEVHGGTSAEPDLEHHWLASYFPIAGEGGPVEAIGLAAIDITGRRQAERELAEMNRDLERRVLERTVELEAANKELEAFSYSASHDLRAPLRALDGFSLALLEDYGERLDDTGKNYLARVRAAAQRMGQLIDDMLMLSRVTRREMARETVDLSALARDILADLRETGPQRVVEAHVADGLVASGDPALLRIVLQNLLANAWKFTSRRPVARIFVGSERRDGAAAYFVRDDGAGFDATYVDKLFTPFQRLHAADEFPGSGIGLATVKRIVRRHGGSVWAEGAVDCGATFYFTLHRRGETDG